MKKFQFKFDHVLTLRKTREEEALRALSIAQSAYQTELNIKKYWISELESSLLRKENLGKNPVPISFFQAEQDYIVGTKQRIAASEQAIVKINRWIEKALRNYLGMKKQRKVIESLYEKDFLKYKRELQKHELRQQDDLTTMRFRLKEEEL